MISPHDLTGQLGKQNWERFSASKSPMIPAMISNGGSTISITDFSGQNLVATPVDVRFNVKVIDATPDSNGYYRVIKWDQWFGDGSNQIIFELRLNTTQVLNLNDLVFAEAYSTSPDGFLLLKDLLRVAGNYKFCTITYVSDVCLATPLSGYYIFYSTQDVLIDFNLDCGEAITCSPAAVCDCPPPTPDCPCPLCDGDMFPNHWTIDLTGFFPGEDCCSDFNVGSIHLDSVGGCTWYGAEGAINATLVIGAGDPNNTATLVISGTTPCSTLVYEGDVTDCCSTITLTATALEDCSMPITFDLEPHCVECNPVPTEITADCNTCDTVPYNWIAVVSGFLDSAAPPDPPCQCSDFMNQVYILTPSLPMPSTSGNCIWFDFNTIATTRMTIFPPCNIVQGSLSLFTTAGHWNMIMYVGAFSFASAPIPNASFNCLGSNAFTFNITSFNNPTPAGGSNCGDSTVTITIYPA